jgi:tyrosyl-tRNA synthetase
MRKIHWEEQLQILKKNTVDLIREEELKERLKRWYDEGIPLRVKYGADPSRPDLHLGHYVCLKKLKDFQELGHRIIFIVGDFTAMIGDPSGRSKTRPLLTKEEVDENAKTYFEQVWKVLDPERTEITYNSKWLSSLKAEDIIKLSSTYTVARMLERDDFKNRFESETPIFIHEFLYPLLQGYDSCMVKADLELGGTDQKFNFIVAREIQREYGQAPQVIMTVPLLEGTDGKLKMSKSYDNYIAITEAPKEMYGKIMSIPDNLVLKYYKLLLYLDNDELRKIEREMEENPRDTKARLAYKIVSIFHSEREAKEAEEEFIRIFREGKLPAEVPVFQIRKGVPLIELMVQSGLVNSKTEARRLIRQRAVKLDGEVVEREDLFIETKDLPKVLKVGKRRFLKLIPFD